MSVKITSVKSKGRFRSETVEHALGNRGDVQTWELSIDVATYNAASTKHEIMVNATDGFVGTGWVFDKSGGFTDFRIGDTVLFHNKTIGPANNQTFTITDKLDGSSIRLSAKVKAPGNLIDLANNSKLNNCIFSVSTPITALRYNYNFIENDGPVTYKSKISGTTQELVIKTISASVLTVLPMEFLGEPSYQTGSATAQGIAIDITTGVYTSKFKIIHQNKILPYPTAEERVDALAAVKPEYFFDDKCLKFIYNIEACTDYTNPNWLQQQLIQDVRGNTGEYNENFNTGTTKYAVSGLIMLKSNGDVLNAIQLSTDDQSIEFRIKNTTDTPFSNNNTKFELQFLKLPFDESEQKLNGRTVDVNFVDDRAFQTVGAASINGEQFGVANRQVFKTVVGTFISSSEIKITCKIAMLPGSAAIFAESEVPTYVFNVAVQNHTLETKKADLVRLPINTQPFFIDYSSPGIIEFENTHYKHWEGGADGSKVNEPGEGFSDLPLFPEDEVTTRTRFFVNKTLYPGDDIRLESLVARIKIKNSVTLEEITLDGFTFPFAGTPFKQGNQFVDYSQDRIFFIPPAEIRKKIRVRRTVGLDAGNKFAYEVVFPFLNRWEYWEKLTVPSGVGDDFFDPNEPFNGLNHNWKRLADFPDWGVYYELKVIGLRNNKVFTEVFENRFTLYHYDNNDNWDPNTLKSYDKDSGLELTDGVKKYLQGFKNTRVEAAFTSVTGTPDLPNIYVNMKIESFEQGGVAGSRRMSSKWASNVLGNETWFKSIDASNKTILTLDGDTVLANVLTDYLKFPANLTKVSIASRLYEALTIPHCICPPGWEADFVNNVCKRTTFGGVAANKQGYNWTPGQRGGLTFNTLNTNGDPTYFNSFIESTEGCTTISNDEGELLFYSNGIRLFDAVSSVPVVTDLRSNQNSQSNSFAVKHPTIVNAYALFCIDEAFSNSGGRFGLTYNIITNVSTSGITLLPANKNINIYGSANPEVAELAVARRNADGSYWIIIEENIAGPNTRYVSIKFRSDATIAVAFDAPVFSASITDSVVHNGGSGKISPDGRFFMKATFDPHWQLYAFDTATGLLSGGIRLDIPGAGSVGYGIEISPNGQFVYISDTNGAKIYRYDITTYDPLDLPASKASIDASITTIADLTVGPVVNTNMQIGPNGRIYVALADKLLALTKGPNYIGVIRDPDDTGAGTTYSSDVPLNAKTPGIYFHGPGENTSIASLPTFEKSITSSFETMPCGERPPTDPPVVVLDPLLVHGTYVECSFAPANEDVSYKLMSDVFEADGTTPADNTASIKMKIFQTGTPADIIFEGTWNVGDDINLTAPTVETSTRGLTWAAIKVYLSGIIGEAGIISINKQDLTKANNWFDNDTQKTAQPWTIEFSASRGAQGSNTVAIALPYLYSLRNWAELTLEFKKTSATNGRIDSVLAVKAGDTVTGHAIAHSGVTFGTITPASTWASGSPGFTVNRAVLGASMANGTLNARSFATTTSGLQAAAKVNHKTVTGFGAGNFAPYETLFILKDFCGNLIELHYAHERRPAPTYVDTLPNAFEISVGLIYSPVITLNTVSIEGVQVVDWAGTLVYSTKYTDVDTVVDAIANKLTFGGKYGIIANMDGSLVDDPTRASFYMEFLVERY